MSQHVDCLPSGFRFFLLKPEDSLPQSNSGSRRNMKSNAIKRKEKEKEKKGGEVRERESERRISIFIPEPWAIH